MHNEIPAQRHDRRLRYLHQEFELYTDTAQRIPDIMAMWLSIVAM